VRLALNAASALVVPSLVGALYVYGSDPPSEARVPGHAILIVGDSWVAGRAYDEPWANPGRFALVGGGFVSRMQGAIGSAPGGNDTGLYLSGMGSVHAASARSSGNLFGAAPDFDLRAYLRAHGEVSDVILLLGTNDYTVPVCAHGSPFDPGSQALGHCSVDQTIANLEHTFGVALALGRTVHWFMPPGWLGAVQSGKSDAATFREAIERVGDELAAHCQGKACHPSAALYLAACAGDDAAPDPTHDADCSANNLVDYGDGQGRVNRLNAPLLFAEDALFVQRRHGNYRLHASGYGYSALMSVLMSAAAAADASLAARFLGFGLDWSARPAVPRVTIGATTATTIEVTPARGSAVDGANGKPGKCGYGDCTYACWATCADTSRRSDDPACPSPGESAFERDIGAASGAAHYVEDPTKTEAPRDVVTLHDGERGVLRGLASSTDYRVVCVALSPTAISHPGVRHVSTAEADDPDSAFQ